MPPVAAPADLAARLADVVLPEASGGDVRLGDLWRGQPVVLVHLRHFG